MYLRFHSKDASARVPVSKSAHFYKCFTQLYEREVIQPGADRWGAMAIPPAYGEC